MELKINLSHGRIRDCWLHPADNNLCVKTAIAGKFKDKAHGLTEILYFIRHLNFMPSIKDVINNMRREAEVYKAVNKFLPGRAAKIYENLIETDKGLGLVCELVKNHDGNISPNLDEYFKSGRDTQKLLTGLNWFAKRIIMRDIFFFDFNRKNFVVKTLSNNKIIIIIVDLKSLNRTGYQGFLHLERIFAPLARIIMYRRLKRLYKNLNLKFNLNKLCRRKFFSNFIVKIRV